MAYHHARSHVCYSNAFLSGLAAHTFDLRIAGTSRRALVDQQFSFSLKKVTGAAASTMTFTLNPGASPAFGQDVVVTIGEDLFWGGTITDVTDVISGQLVRQSVECIDWRWRLDSGPRITRRFEDVACNTAVATVVHETPDAADGFRLGFVSPSLPRVTVDLEDATVMEALSAIANAAGASVLRIRPTKRVDMYSTGFPSAQALTLVNGSRGLAGTLARRTDSGQVRNRTRVIGSAAATTAFVLANATEIPVETPALFNPAGIRARVVTTGGALYVTYTAVSGSSLVGVTGLTYDVEEGAEVAPVETGNDAAAQTAMAATLGRSNGVIVHVMRIEGDYRRCAIVAAADVATYKNPMVALDWIDDGPLARFFEAGEPVTVTLTAPITESGTYTVQAVELTPGDVMASDNPRWLAKVSMRTARRPDLADMIELR